VRLTFSIFHFPKFQNGRRSSSIFSPAKNRSAEGVSMSGFERLDRLSLPRRTRRRRAWNGNYRHGARTKATIELWRFIKSLS
jgi:hypothetical protein